ncbi:ATPase family associated with various cellular activities (AAA) family protein 3 [Achromobacter xylosoxidans A8]|uniref:ATPase family associated with various cellular activities (AAA) family protein 3 n=1 Tax=Achromobacter xylosoxidans (strain A8) TaxID=762376 RepID=E3HVE6_ACHXA|nr:ATP-binding protein [Achromobacter xylosoxidans]ADP18719.1 ATPase family associated with various cellular activities (AAA) family protein 3 [Achromobacter xylosoxidans A8]
MNVPAESRILALWDTGSQSRPRALAQAAEAAEALARETGLELRRIDLSKIVSKYIAETEKNLNRLFESVEQRGAVLFFDEADALFGKRADIKNSHDRYANIEVNYLLQPMESYRGLTLRAAGLKSNLDSAFLRRLRLVVQFPAAAADQRARLWSRAFPIADTSTEITMARLLQAVRAEPSQHARPLPGAKTRGYP